MLKTLSITKALPQHHLKLAISNAVSVFDLFTSSLQRDILLTHHHEEVTVFDLFMSKLQRDIKTS